MPMIVHRAALTQLIMLEVDGDINKLKFTFRARLQIFMIKLLIAIVFSGI